MSEEIHIQFTRFSAFYSPLIATIAGGFLKEEGLQPKRSNAPVGKSAIDGVVAGTVHVCQSAPSQGFGPLEKGQTPPAVHFAQINEKDGFFLTGRAADPEFSWDKLKGEQVLVDHGGQPLAMFKYACHKRGLDYKAINAVDVPSAEMDGAFRKGQGDYIHQQGPAPQQLEHDGAGHVVASVGGGDRPVRVLEPGGHARVARHRYGPPVHARVPEVTRLADHDTGQQGRRGRVGLLPRDRPRGPRLDYRLLSEARLLVAHVEITRPAFEVALDVFQHSGLITKRHRYEDVVAPPPDVA